ncbi:MAG TPA: hypothetical protein VMA86_02230, partial [Acetobacteraceae bacterium]|nr:hypothetical protein [Acetobacteraceae bacterium]
EAELDADAAVDIGHEALIRRWERLGGREQTSWVRAELEDAEHYRDLLRYGQLGGLIPKAQLREFEGWWARRRPTRVWAQRYTPGGADKFDVATEVLRRSRARVMRDRWLIGAGAALVVLLIAVLAFLRAETVRAQLRYAQQLVEEKQAELAYQKYQAGVQAREAAERQAFFQEQARLSAEREARLVAFAGVQALATKSAYQALLLAQYGLSPASRLPLMPENEALAYDALQQMHERSVFQVARCVPPAIAFRPDGGLIAFADGSLRLWNPATGAEQTGWSIRVAMQWALALSLNPAGDEVLLNGVDGGQRRAILVDLKSRGVIPFAAGTEPGFGVFSPDGRLIVTSGPGRAVIIWALGAEAAKGGIDEGGAEMVRRPDPAPAGAVEEFAQDPALAVSPSSRVLAISATGGRIDLVSLGERRAMTTLPDPRSANGPQGAGEAAGDVFSLAFDPRDGNRLLAIYRGGAAYLWNIGEQRRISLRTPARVIRALFSADGRFVAAVSSDELVRVWDLRDARGGGPGWVPAWIMRGSNGPFWTIAMADDGRIATGSMAGSVWLWERDAALARGLPRVPDSPDAAGPSGGAVSRNGTSVSMHGNQVIVRSAVAGQRSGALMIPPGVKMPAVPAIAQDGMWVLLAPVRGPILLYDLHDLHGPFGSALPVAAFGKRSSAWAWATFAGAPDRVIGETRTGATHSWRFFRDPQALRSFATASLPLVDGRKPELPPAAREQVGGSFWSALSNADSASLDQGCR